MSDSNSHSTFVANKSYGNCCICKRELRRGTVIRSVKLTGYSTNVRGFAHGNLTECKQPIMRGYGESE